MSLWNQCLERLRQELPTQQFSMWIRPLVPQEEEGVVALFAPNRFILDWVRDKYVNRINELVSMQDSANPPLLRFDVGSIPTQTTSIQSSISQIQPNVQPANKDTAVPESNLPKTTNVRVKYTFDNFVEGKSNQLARAAASQVADNPGAAYNPLFIYGGTGLGKTHLLHAVGNGILLNKPNAKIAYMHSCLLYTSDAADE